MPEEFTLIELSDQVGLLPRTIRSYIEQGLIQGPEVGGRGARYTRYHLDRLRAIHVLKNLRGMSLADVRHSLLTLPPQDITALAREADEKPEQQLVQSSSSALDYLKSLKARPTAAESTQSQQVGPTPVDKLLRGLQELAVGQKVARKARGEAWFRIAVTPDVEIRVRGMQTADQLARWERIADHVRHILLGSVKEESL